MNKSLVPINKICSLNPRDAVVALSDQEKLTFKKFGIDIEKEAINHLTCADCGLIYSEENKTC